MSDEDVRLQALAERYAQYTQAGVDRLKGRAYNPTLFLRLVRERGAVGATKQLLVGNRHTSYGFERLWELGASVEFAVCLPWFRELFTVDEQEEAERRLVLHDFPLARRLAEAEQSPPAWLHEM